MVLKSPQLTISITLITQHFQYALKSVERPKPIAAYQVNRSRQKFSLATKCPRGLIWSTNRDVCQLKNKLERDFQISKHNFLSQRENYIMGYPIVSGNKPSSVALHQHSIIYPNAWIKCQKFIRNLNMPKFTVHHRVIYMYRFRSTETPTNSANGIETKYGRSWLLF